MAHIDVAVIAAGVSGLAAARAIAQRGHSVSVLERHPRPGLETSSHNSGIIHAGLYYPAGTLKARRTTTDQGRVRRCARAGDRRRRDDLSDVASFVNLFVFLMFLLPIGVQPDMVPPGFGFMIYLNRFTT